MRGFTLLELIATLLISTMILLGIMQLSTSMVRYHFSANLRGDVMGWTMMSLARMNREIEDATRITITSQRVLAGCLNYSASMPVDNKLDSTKPISSFYYCVNNAGLCQDGSGVNSNCLLRYGDTVCPPTVPASCGAGSYQVVAKSFHFENEGPNCDPAIAPASCIPYFQVSGQELNAIELHYIVGTATPTVGVPLPEFLRVKTTLRYNKATNNGTD